MAKILVVDDESSIRRTLKEILEFEKHKITLAPNGMEALEIYKEEEFDAHLMEIIMKKFR